jgi:ribosomal protein S18 acetylase RimI-like enzyme
MKVHPIHPSDIPAIARAVVAAWQTAYRGIVSDAYLDGLDVDRIEQACTQIVEMPDRTNLVVEVDGQVIGFVGFGAVRDKDTDPAQVAEVYGLYVHPDHWRKGAGSALMEAALKRLRQDGYTEVVLWTMRDNTPAHGFYEKGGFRRDGAEKRSERQGEQFVEVRFRRKISTR